MDFYSPSRIAQVPFDTLVTDYLSQHNGVFSTADMLSFHSQISMLKPVLFVATLSYLLLPLVVAFFWILARPSDWTYKYLWHYVTINFFGMLGATVVRGSDENTISIRQQHILEYGRDLREFWARVWWYTLPFNSLLLVYSIV